MHPCRTAHQRWRAARRCDTTGARPCAVLVSPAADGDGTVQQAAAATGTLFADPGAIRPFADPAVEIQGDRDLVDYVLPGLTGSGADCLAERIDVDEVLASRTADGAAAVADLILACVASDEIGKVFGMYAVGFEDDGRSRYADLAACVTDGFSDLDRNRTEPSLVLVLDERLDLADLALLRLQPVQLLANQPLVGEVVPAGDGQRRGDPPAAGAADGFHSCAHSGQISMSPSA